MDEPQEQSQPEYDEDKLLSKFRPHAPDEKSDDDIRAIIKKYKGDEKRIQRKLAEWWESGEGGGENGAKEPERKKPSKTRSGKASQDKEMMDFRHLMVKGLELKRFKNDSPEKCVIYMDVTCRTFFVAKQKNAANAKAYRVEDIVEAAADQGNEKIISIIHKDSKVDLEVSSPKVRDYLVRMLNKLFTAEKSNDAPASSPRKASSRKPSSASEKESSSSSGKSRSSTGKSRSSRKDEQPRSHRLQLSQVRLLAEHCYSLTDDKVEELVSAKIPTHSRWESYQEFKDKINRRDELIRSLQDGLGTMNGERVKFQRACEDIELHHQGELQELKQHLAMALQSFQELQRASEHRESEMREALNGAVERSKKFEVEKKQLIENMDEQRMAAASSEKEVGVLRESIDTKRAEYDKKSAEFEDARKRFTQVKEALTVERNLRARAEIKEEQMRQETVTLTDQMGKMKEKLKAELKKSVKVEDHTDELQEKLDGLIEHVKNQNAEKERLTQELAVKEEEAKTLNSAVAQSQTEYAKYKTELEEQCKRVDVLRGEEAQLTSEMAGMKDDHQVWVDRESALLSEQQEKLDKANETIRAMESKIQELRGNVRVILRVRPFLAEYGEDTKGTSLITVSKRETRGAWINFGDDEAPDDNEYLCDQDPRPEDVEKEPMPGMRRWLFDRVFDRATEQQEVYKEMHELTQSAWEGYNVCLLCYGQTGSGKSHTLFGGKTDEMFGIIRRTYRQMKDLQADFPEWEYSVSASYVEIDDEKVYDLLRASKEEREPLDIKLDPKGRTAVVGATKFPLIGSDVEEREEEKSEGAEPTYDDDGNEISASARKPEADPLEEVLVTARVNHRSPEDDMPSGAEPEEGEEEEAEEADKPIHKADLTNTVFTLHIQGVSESLGAKVRATFTFCDITGSENKSNASLQNLHEVFDAITSRQAYVPFNKSKLTYLLQPALMGDDKVTMIVNVKPTQEARPETLECFRLAMKAKTVELGKAVRNVSETTDNTAKRSVAQSGGKTGGTKKASTAKKGGKR